MYPMFRDYSLQTTWGRAVLALATGAIIGAIGTTLLYLPGHFYVWNRDMLEIVGFWTDTFFFNLYYFSIAMFLVGAPIWFLAHKLGFRTRKSAIFVGFGLSFFFVFGGVILSFLNDAITLTREMKSLGPFWYVLFPFLVIPLTGTAIALTIWHIAYRRLSPPTGQQC